MLLASLAFSWQLSGSSSRWAASLSSPGRLIRVETGIPCVWLLV